MRLKRRPNLKIFLLFLPILLLILNCDEKKEFNFPYAKVDMELHIYTDLSDLGAYSGKKYLDEGIGGIIIFKIDENKYYAFDLACTNEIPDVCVINEFQKSSIIWECPCCHSQYTISTDGCYINKGPAEWPLKTYRTYIIGDFLYITN